ncbi:MAG: V-type ATP synthase subunit A, partial [Spirochaetota bacterium]
DKDLAAARHFPSINWMHSFSGYLNTAQIHWSAVEGIFSWRRLRQEAVDILKEDDALLKVVKLIGSDALPEMQKLVLFTANLIKEGFLQQLAFDPVDSYCPLKKQLRMMDCILKFHARAKQSIGKNVPAQEIANLPAVAKILRAKSEISGDDDAAFDELNKEADFSFDELEKRYEKDQ